MKRLLLIALLILGILSLLPLLRQDAGSAPKEAGTPAAQGGGDQPPRPMASAAPQDKLPPTSPPAVATTDRRIVPAATAQKDAEQGVFGRLVDRAGIPVVGAAVALRHNHDEAPIDAVIRLQQQVPDPPVAAGESDAAGAFALGLPSRKPTTVDLVVHAAGQAPLRLTRLHVAPGDWLDAGTLNLTPGATIRGRVTIAGTSLPAPHASISWTTGNPFVDLDRQADTELRERTTATTDSNGRYELHGVPSPGIVRLAAEAPGFARAFRPEIALDSGDSLVVDFSLATERTISGQLVAALPLQTARIEAWSQNREPAHHATVSADGTFEIRGLAEARYTLRIDAEGFEPIERPGVPAGTTNLRIDLEARGAITLSVRDPLDQPVTKFRVALRRWFEQGNLGIVREVPERIVDLRDGSDTTRIEGIGRGTYVLQVFADGHAATLSPPFSKADTDTTPHIEVRLVYGGALSGRVVDEQGRPIAAATIRTEPDGAVADNPVWRMVQGLVPDRITRTTTTTDQRGEFTLPRLAFGAYQLVVEHDAFCPAVRRDVTVERDGPLRLDSDIRLLRGVEVSGRVLQAGSPQPGCVVVLSTPSALTTARETTAPDQPAIRIESRTDNQGRFAFSRRIPPGDYELRAATASSSDPAGNALLQLQQMRDSMQRVKVTNRQPTVDVDLRLPEKPR
jgi:hypothetical protein